MKRGTWLPLLFLALGMAAIGGFAGAAWALGDDGEGSEQVASAVERPLARESPRDEGEFGPDRFGRGQGPRGATGGAFLGVVLADVPDGEGVRVAVVAPLSPAERAGFEVGDVIVAVDGERVDEAGEVVDIVRDAEPGAELTFTVGRDEDEHELRVTLGERPFDLGELMPQMPWEAPGPPEGRVPHELRPFPPGLRPFSLPGLGRLFDGPESFLDRFVSAELVFLNDEGEIETLRAVAGTVESVDGDELVLAPKDGGPDERFDVSDETQVRRLLARAELDDIEEGDNAVVITKDGDEAVAIVILRGLRGDEPS